MNPIRPIIAAAVWALAAAGAAATPAQIIFLRHAEKPEHGPELNARGWERADALVGLFEHDPRVHEHGAPVAIFAAYPPKAGGSIRSIQTMEATGKALQVAVNTSITRDDLDGLVNAILHTKADDGKTVVVCWEHKKIPQMLRDFGWTTGPRRWDDTVFDRLWILDFEGDHPVRFRDLPQHLLSGDPAS